MSVIDVPSIWKSFWLPLTPGARNADCWPDSEPPTFTRSTRTPRVCESRAHGSRAVGIFSSSTWLTLVPVESFRSSSSGLSEVTVIVSSSAAVSTRGTLVLRPRATTTSGNSIPPKPSSSAATV